jgi:hypothetical protein
MQLMRDEKLITESEYHMAEHQMLEKYHPFFRLFIHLIIVSNRVIYSVGKE